MTSLEQRQQIKQLVKQGIKAPQIAKTVQLSVHTVRKWQQRIKKGALCLRTWAVPKAGQ